MLVATFDSTRRNAYDTKMPCDRGAEYPAFECRTPCMAYFLFFAYRGYMPYENGTQVPNVSVAQRGAMAAAAAGKSSIGIPAKIGREFMSADKGGKLPARKKKRIGLINQAVR
jgi:hypothetical protein